MNKEYKAVVDDGTKEIPMLNKFGKEICKVHFRPADFSIIDRYNETVNGLPEILEPLKKITLKNDGTAKFDKDWAVIKGVEAGVKAKINYLFDMDEADAIFEHRNAFASVGGNFFCVLVLNALGEVIEKAVANEAELSKKRMQKYMTDLEPIANPNDVKAEPEVVNDAGATADEP